MSRVVVLLLSALALVTACDPADLGRAAPHGSSVDGPADGGPPPVLAAPKQSPCAQAPGGTTFVIVDGRVLICGTNGPKGG